MMLTTGSGVAARAKQGNGKEGGGVSKRARGSELYALVDVGTVHTSSHNMHQAGLVFAALVHH